jgi:prepilin-type N-terminal cleavage/methylation domain-containing protein
MDMKGMLKKEAGITLIELMVVLVLAAVVTAAIYAIFIAQQKSYATQTKVSDMQQNARAALTLMERDLRMAGSGVGSSFTTVKDFLNNDVNAAITIVNNTSPTPDRITVVYAAQLISTVSSVSDKDVYLASVTGFGATNGTQYIAFETVNGVYTIQSIDVNTKKLTLNTAPPAHLATIAYLDPDTGAVITGARAYLVKAITYQVDTARNTLERVASDQIGTVPDVPDDLWDDVGNHITNLQIVWPFSGNNNLLQVTLTGQDTDADGTTMIREHQAVINIRN